MTVKVPDFDFGFMRDGVHYTFKFPSEDFDFIHNGSRYNLQKVDDTWYCHSYETGWTIDYDDMSMEHAAMHLAEGVWTIVNKEETQLVKQTNGVDVNGKALNFTAEDIQPFDRVVIKELGTYLAIQTNDGMQLLKDGGWTGPEYFDHEDFPTVEVYAAPGYYSDYLNIEVRGDLRWKREEQKNEFAGRLAYFETHIESVRENLESLEAAFADLKKQAA